MMSGNQTTTHLSSLILCAALSLFGASASAQQDSAHKPRDARTDAELARAAELNAQVEQLHGEGKYREALAPAREALAIREEALGPDHPDVAESLNNLAVLHEAMGEYAKALPLYVRALIIREKALGPDHLDVAESLNNLAGLHRVMGEYARALPLFERALAITENALSPDHPVVATILNNLAGLHQAMGEYAKALPLFERSLAIKEKVFGPDHPNVGSSLNNLAGLHQAMGKYARALPLFERALAIMEKALGSDHPRVAISQNSLAGLYQAMGEYARALPLFERALATREKALVPGHSLIAQSLNNVAALHQAMGEYARALPLHERALEIWEKALGPDHPDVAMSLGNLAVLHRDMGGYARALLLYERALAIQEKVLGPEHPRVATALKNLAVLYSDMGEYAKALQLYERALAIREKALGPNHPGVALSLNNLARLHHVMGEYDKTLSLYERALAITEMVVGPDHPYVATFLDNLAQFHWARSEYARTLPVYQRALAIEARYLGQWLHSGSEYQRHRRIAGFSRRAERRVSFHLSSAPADPGASRLAVESILLYKGRVLESMVDIMRAAHLDADPEGRAMLRDLRGAHAALSRLFVQGPGDDPATQERYRRRRVELERRIDELEARLSARSEPYRRLRERVTVAALQERLPRDAALIELFVYRPYNARATGQAALKPWGEPHYAAYVMRHDGPVHGVDLGPVAVLDQAVTGLRESFALYRANAKEHARAVHAQVMQPLEAHLGNATRVYVAPAGQLSFVPFAALVDPRGLYLVERYSFTYLTSGRQFAQSRSAMNTHAAEARADTIIANPSFGVFAPAPVADITTADAPDTDALRSRDAAAIGKALPLPGTAEEAETLQALLPGSTVWTRAQATETAVKDVRGPRILHLATHGFFLPDQALEREVMADLGADDLPVQPGLGVRGPRVPVENALLRSGLLLAGANQRRDPAGDNDGILSALEVSAMDLAGTRMVVLSACDTGIGDQGPSQAIYGLRRAFAIAGAETLVMSLWKVDDDRTRDLMTRYYRYLLAGEGRAEAMRRVQLDHLRQGGNHAHPYYWASFVVSGDDTTMAGQPARLAPMRVRSGGCAGCRADDASPGLWLCALVLLALGRRHRAWASVDRRA